MRAKLFDPGLVDDPFDAVYSSELKRDVLLPGDVENIVKYSKIKDLSDTISFKDE